MTQEETGRILALIYAIFPRAYERAGAEATRNAWAVMFEDEFYSVVLTAVKKVLKTSKFAPTISEVSEEISKYKQILRHKLDQHRFYSALLTDKCEGCTAYKNHIEQLQKCGAKLCPYEISEETKREFYLTDEEQKQIRAILAGPKQQLLLSNGIER